MSLPDNRWLLRKSVDSSIPIYVQVKGTDLVMEKLISAPPASDVRGSLFIQSRLPQHRQLMLVHVCTISSGFQF